MAQPLTCQHAVALFERLEYDMFPFIQLIKDLFIAPQQMSIDSLDTHVSHHVISPWDLDAFAALNSSRAPTLYDLGRLGMGVHTELIATLRKNEA